MWGMKLFKRIIILTAIALAFTGGLGLFDSVQSANLSNAKVTLSTPRLSYFAELAAGNTVGESLVTLGTTGASDNTRNIFANETVTIGTGTYTVADATPTNSTTDNETTLQLTSGLLPGDADVGDDVIRNQTTTMNVSFTTTTAITDGTFRVLVPAATSNNADGLPDQTGWDGTSSFETNVTVTCPSGVAGYTFGTATTDANQTVGGVIYHVFTCPYTGAGGVNTAFSGGTAEMVIAGLINPAPDADHRNTATDYVAADNYRIIVQHMDGANVIDQTSVAVALIEAVRITASVAPQITFQIKGVAASTSVCGITTSVATTPTLVPLGELAINLFKTAAQQLVVATNAQGGYVVTAVSADQLRRLETSGGSPVVCTGSETTVSGCIPDAKGDGAAAMSSTVAEDWDATTAKGFGYTLDNDATVPAASVAFEYNVNSSGGSCGTLTQCYRQFADAEASEVPATLFSSTTVADNQTVNVCYKAVISTTQEAGEDYATAVTYRATATF